MLKLWYWIEKIFTLWIYYECIHSLIVSPLQAPHKYFKNIYYWYLIWKYMLLMSEWFYWWPQIMPIWHSNWANLAPNWPPNDAETRRPSDSCARIARASSLGSVALRGNFLGKIWATFLWTKLRGNVLRDSSRSPKANSEHLICYIFVM